MVVGIRYSESLRWGKNLGVKKCTVSLRVEKESSIYVFRLLSGLENEKRTKKKEKKREKRDVCVRGRRSRV